MLRPTNPGRYSDEFRCYIWALLHSTQLSDFNFYPRVCQSSKARRFNFNFGMIQGFIYIHSWEINFFIPDSVWVAYLSAYGIPEKEQRYYYVGCPF